MKKNKGLIIVLVISITAIVLLEYYKPQKNNWTQTFSSNDKNPFGSYVVYDLIQDLFPSQSFTTSRQTIYENQKNYPGSASFNYLFINHEFAPSTYDVESLLRLVNQGATCFIAAYTFSGKFADTLHLETYVHHDFNIDTITRYHYLKLLSSPSAYYRSRIGYQKSYFTSFDSTQTTVLGFDSLNYANFIAMNYGKGKFYIHTMPIVFTNYNILYENQSYISKVFSYLPIQSTQWDEYYKLGRSGPRTPLRFILANESLRWSYYTLLILIFIFIIFHGKRRQRVIPVVKPLENTTLEFTETVGRLYFQHGNHHDLAEKKIAYFLDYIRRHLFLSTAVIDHEFYERLAHKSGYAAKDIETLFQYIESCLKNKHLSDQSLRILHEKIELFYKKTRR